MAYDTITLPNDPLNVSSTLFPAVGTTIGGSLNFPTGAGAATGTVTLSALGVPLPGESFTGFTATLSGTTYTLTSAANALGQQVVIKYNTATPNIVPSIVVQTVPILGLSVTLASATNATVTSSQNIPCYASGTLIRTARGEVAVEDLRVGDMAVTTSGKSRRIVWLGSSDIDIRLMDHPTAYQPIRIAADAFGQGMPYRDLTVSPGHALCVRVLDEVLVPAVVLVNDATITQLDEDRVTYWHVELDAHDIMYANGLPAESYINVGNRTFFEAGLDAADPVRTLADYCRPYVAEGVLVQAMCAQLKLRAQMLGWSLEGSSVADLHLVADGTRVEPSMNGMTARFDVPASAREVWLVSNASVPAHVSDNADRRELGVRLQGLRIGSRNVAIDDPSLCVGFHTVEGTGAAIQRWTAGRARLPASLWAGARGDVTIALELVGPALPRWVAPADREAEPKRDGSHLSLVAAA